MIKIYLSSTMNTREEMQQYKREIEKTNPRMFVDSTWIYAKNAVDPLEDRQVCREFATTDLFEIRQADLVVFFPGPVFSHGKNIEFGYALAKDKKIYCIGEPKSIFHHLADRTFKDFDAFLEFIK